MKQFICWCCEYSKNSGEGQLARKFIRRYYKTKKIKIIKPNSNFFFSKYLNQFIGIFYLWYYFFKGSKLIYLNYLPLWNFFIFLLLPPKTILGPITGSIQINKISGFKSILRFYLFPILYKISLSILNKRLKNIIFSTNILVNFINKNLSKKIKLNFILENFKFKKKYKRKKKYDLIVYFREHENKFFKHHFKLIYKFINNRKRVVVFGDKINIKGVVQFGNIKKNKVSTLIKESKYSLSGDDNLLSLFNLEVLENRIKIIYNYKLKFQIPKIFEKLFIAYNFEKSKYIE